MGDPQQQPAMLHTLYKGPEGETTQWEDIQVRLGNMAPRPKPWKPEKYAAPAEEARDAAWLAARDEDELSGAEDEFPDDRALEELRQKRLTELRSAAARPRFTGVEELVGSEFVQKVTDASADYWVVCLLYKPSHPGCELLGQCLDALASKYCHTRFVRIVSTAAIPSYPDTNLPTLLVYRDRACKRSLVGLSQFGGARATPERVAVVLNTAGPVCDEAGGDDEAAAQAAAVKGLVTRLVAQREEGDESSDFGSD
ncbi:Pdcl3 [Scenedesmus sp. PABB004]|nr:Pdcl3 [Scenedesmus sp. PABB004]